MTYMQPCVTKENIEAFRTAFLTELTQAALNNSPVAWVLWPYRLELVKVQTHWGPFPFQHVKIWFGDGRIMEWGEAQLFEAEMPEEIRALKTQMSEVGK